MRVHITDRDYEQISTYMDGQLAQSERRKLETRLNAVPELKAALDEMVRTRALLKQAPRRHAPRNFTLTPAMVGDQAPRKKRGFSFNLFPAMSFASALATLALVASLVFQLVPGLQQQAALTAEPMMSAAAQPTENQRQMKNGDNAPPAGAPAAGAPEAAAPAPAAEATQTASDAYGAQGLTAPNAEAPAADAQNSVGAAPPIITWNPDYGKGGAGGPGGPVATGRGGGGGGGPSTGDLLGPPAANNLPGPVYGMGGGGEAGGNVMIPQESLKSLEPQARSSIESAQPAEVNPNINGTGPILGVPEPGAGGQIIDQRLIQGYPNSNAPGLSPESSSGEQDQSAQQQDRLFGLPRLAVIQALLALIAVATGVTALVLRSKSKA